MRKRSVSDYDARLARLRAQLRRLKAERRVAILREQEARAGRATNER